jgi:chromosome partitioning protein
VIENSDEDSIIDDIEDANQDSAFVIVDLEGTASMAVASAISRADLVIILCQGSQDDADEAIKTIKLIKRQERLLARKIVYSVLFTHPAITPRTLTYIINEFKRLEIEMFHCSLIDREAFRAIRSFGGTIENLDPNEVFGKDKAIANILAFTEEVKIKLLSLSK